MSYHKPCDSLRELPSDCRFGGGCCVRGRRRSGESVDQRWTPPFLPPPLSGDLSTLYRWTERGREPRRCIVPRRRQVNADSTKCSRPTRETTPLRASTKRRKTEQPVAFFLFFPGPHPHPFPLRFVVSASCVAAYESVGTPYQTVTQREERRNTV